MQEQLTGRDLDAEIERVVFGRDVIGWNQEQPDGDPIRPTPRRFSDPGEGWQYLPLILERLRELELVEEFVRELSILARGSVRRWKVGKYGEWELYGMLFGDTPGPELSCRAALAAMRQT
ncbi:MAG: hypothetical protein M3P51_11320 [Chloroflexota bacterium]|nr:hypothetical protein [Chloroflexota bacterium]